MSSRLFVYFVRDQAGKAACAAAVIASTSERDDADADQRVLPVAGFTTGKVLEEVTSPLLMRRGVM